MSLTDQVDLLYDLFATLRLDEGDLPIHLAGHSMGGILALMTAADPRSGQIKAIDVCGVPLVYDEATAAALDARKPSSGQTHYPALGRDHVRARFYGADGSFSPRALEFDAAISSMVPVLELVDAAQAPRTLPQTMQRIALPVRMTFAGEESSSVADEAVCVAATTYLAQNPHSRVRIEPGCGHNISLHHLGGVFHDSMLDWFDIVG
ncbi:pimeloyl-ACP methyl ester carboxylesterase [Sphingopyxis sp. JAI128]|nr:pimeloyl-ACP methyl ester carboxylesterase [Sphingopyxis sp. JAI128]